MASLVPLCDAGPPGTRCPGGDARADQRTGKKSGDAGDRWLELSVPEVRRRLPGGGQVAGRTSQATALVALAPPAPGDRQALPSGAPRASGSTRVLPGARSHAAAESARAHRRPLGAVAPAPAAAEAADGPSGG